MGREVATFDLRTLHLAPGGAKRLDLSVPPVALRLGGSDYATDPAAPEVRLDISRSLTGLHLRLRTGVDLVGPCWRCLGDARVPLAVDTSEFAADGREGEEFDEDLDSAYVGEGALDLALWARDAIAEAVPATILCRDDCAGLCPVCGVDLNASPHAHEERATDPRWDALREISERLGRQE